MSLILMFEAQYLPLPIKDAPGGAGAGEPGIGSYRPRRKSLLSPSLAENPSRQGSFINPTAPGTSALLERIRTVSLTGCDPGSPAMGSPSGLPRAPSSRPTSGRSRGIQSLIDAIRSKNEGKVLEALESFRQPSGAYAGASSCRSYLVLYVNWRSDGGLISWVMFHVTFHTVVQVLTISTL